MEDVTYRLADLIGKKIFAGSRGIYVYKLDKKGKRYRSATLQPFAMIGKLKHYQIFDAKQVGKPNETWVLFFDGGGFIFLPKKEKNLIDVSRFKTQGIKSDQQQIAENQEKYNVNPLTAGLNSLKETLKKYPALIYLGAGLIIYKIVK